MNDVPVARVPIGLLVGDWLSPSETFIHDQVVHAQRTQAYVCARRRVASAAARFPYEHVCALDRWAELRFKWTRRAPRFVDYLRAHRVELLHAHFGTNGAHALELVDALDVPLVVTFHGHDVAGLEPRNHFTKRYFQFQRLKTRLWQRSSLLLCASADLAERLIERHGAPAQKVVVHHLGVDLQRFRFVPRSGSPRVLLSVGRMVEKKGLEYGLEAFARARAAFPELRYRIVGEGPLRQRLERRAAELELAESVDFLGALSHEAVLSEMRAADVFLCPSVTAANGDRESGVLVLKEAAATGLPTIGTRHGGIPEIIDDDRTGYLIDERDSAALGERLIQLLEDDALRARFGEAAAAKMQERYDTRAQNALLEVRLLKVLEASLPLLRSSASSLPG